MEPDPFGVMIGVLQQMILEGQEYEARELFMNISH